MVKYGMNLLLWTSDVSEEHFPLFAQLKEIGYDGVELPVFDLSEEKFTRVGAELKKKRTHDNGCHRVWGRRQSNFFGCRST